jgi:hypothetical protein
VGFFGRSGVLGLIVALAAPAEGVEETACVECADEVDAIAGTNDLLPMNFIDGFLTENWRSWTINNLFIFKQPLLQIK